eukprot:scaffold11212_cov28-Tisochrysis_lutea.AAC.1
MWARWTRWYRASQRVVLPDHGRAWRATTRSAANRPLRARHRGCRSRLMRRLNCKRACHRAPRRTPPWAWAPCASESARPGRSILLRPSRTGCGPSRQSFARRAAHTALTIARAPRRQQRPRTGSRPPARARRGDEAEPLSPAAPGRVQSSIAESCRAVAKGQAGWAGSCPAQSGKAR